MKKQPKRESIGLCEQIRRGDTCNSQLQTVVGDFLADLAARNYSPATVDKRRDCLRKFLLFLEAARVERFQDVTAAVLETYRSVLASDDYSSFSVESYLRSMRLFFEWLADRGDLFENPAAGFRIIKPPVVLGLVLTEVQVKALLAAPDLSTRCGLRDRAMLEMLYSTGMRRSELVNLTILDVDPDQRSVRVKGKGGKERLLPMGRHAAEYLALYVKDARPRLLPPTTSDTPELWYTHLYRPIKKSSIAQMVQRHATNANLSGRITTHTIRRSCATHLLRNGAHPVAVAELLGHSNLRSLSHYLKITITDMMKTHAKTNPGK